MGKVTITHEAVLVPAAEAWPVSASDGWDLLYEAEWNEEATPGEHMASMLYFAGTKGLHVDAVSNVAMWGALVRASDGEGDWYVLYRIHIEREPVEV